jgi:hypothetical protein
MPVRVRILVLYIFEKKRTYRCWQDHAPVEANVTDDESIGSSCSHIFWSM